MKDNSYFVEKVNVFLNDNHPDLILKLGNTANDYILLCAAQAEDTFEKETGSGTHQDVALEIALNSFKEGLLYSKFNSVNEIIQEYYPDRYKYLNENGNYISMIIEIINNCEPVFQKYNISDGFPYNTLFETELLGAIDLYFENNQMKL